MVGWFAETTLVASALAAVAALAGRVRPIGPTARHVLWLAVLVKLVTPPLVSWPWASAWRGLDWLQPSSRAESVCESTAVCREPVVALAAEEHDASPTPHPRAVAIECVAMDQRDGQAAAPAPIASPDRPAAATPGLSAAGSERFLFAAWMAATGLLAAGQIGRILRFRRRLRLAVTAPDDLVEEAARIAERIGGRVPELLVVPDLGTPLLWCLGRPKLLLPAHLVKTIDRERWRGILVHELAHLRRGDHWVSRLELVAGLIWWWNPLYWLTRARLEAEAELACDAWVVWALPQDRLAYAETLFDIGSALSRAVSPAPALGAAGSGRFLERRLIMILHERVPCRLSPLVLLAALFLVLLALPSWSAPADPPLKPPAAVAALGTAAHPVPLVSVADDDPKDEVDDDDDDADDDDADDDDDDDDDKAAAQAKQKAEERAKRAEERAKRAEERAKRAEERAKGKVAEKAKDKKAKSDIEVEIEKSLGPDFEKKMEELGERIAKEIEAKFGPEFQEKMEKLGKEMEAKFGPEFQEKMERFGKEMEAKFGPGSEFEKKMKDLGKDMESKFGPGSDFEKEMKKLGEELGSKFGPGSEFAKKTKERGEQAKAKAGTTGAGRGKAAAEAGRDAKEAPKGKAATRRSRRQAQIAALEAQIRKLTEELKRLEDEGDEDER